MISNWTNCIEPISIRNTILNHNLTFSFFTYVRTSQSYIAMRHSDHGDLVFLSEAEIRASLIFEVNKPM
jgi:hypothetical protein